MYHYKYSEEKDLFTLTQSEKNMLEKLGDAVKRYRALEEMLGDPEVISDHKQYTKLMREYKSLAKIAEKYGEFTKLDGECGDLREMLDMEDDEEMRALAKEDLDKNEDIMRALIDELRILILPRDPNDDKNVIVEIRGGAGGEEAALFANSLYRMYSMYCASAGYKTEIIGANETELGGYKEIDFMIEGDGAYSRFKFESGVHRVQRVPETETQGRIHTSTVTVAVLPEAEEIEVVINPADIIIESCKSSGAGGQHVNKTESAVRLTHKPTGIVVECQEERSQFKNRDKAMKVLRAKLQDMQEREQNDKITSERKSQVGTGDRSERIRTYNYPQGRVTDHRIGLTLYSLENFLNGNIQEMIDALITADTSEKLKNSEF